MQRSWLVVALVACTGGTAAKDRSPASGGSATGSGSVSQTMKPGVRAPTVSWIAGPALTSPAKDVIAWFEAQKRNGEPRLTRVPIVLSRGQVGFDGRGVRIGTGPDPVEVYISDAALGIGIRDRARACPDPTCPFIVEGFWRGQGEGGYHYEIRTASPHPITSEELAAFTHAEVEGESGN